MPRANAPQRHTATLEARRDGCKPAVQHDDAAGAEPWSGEAQRHRDRGLEPVAELLALHIIFALLDFLVKDDPGVGARHVIQLDPRVRLPERGGHEGG